MRIAFYWGMLHFVLDSEFNYVLEAMITVRMHVTSHLHGSDAR